MALVSPSSWYHLLGRASPTPPRLRQQPVELVWATGSLKGEFSQHTAVVWTEPDCSSALVHCSPKDPSSPLTYTCPPMQGPPHSPEPHLCPHGGSSPIPRSDTHLSVPALTPRGSFLSAWSAAPQPCSCSCFRVPSMHCPGDSPGTPSHTTVTSLN